jgi:membrane protein YqaA with SNARE-associated domain
MTRFLLLREAKIEKLRWADLVQGIWTRRGTTSSIFTVRRFLGNVKWDATTFRPELWTVVDEALSTTTQSEQACSSRIIERVTSFFPMLRHLGGIGVFILAALDSSVLPTLGAVDAPTIILAARHPELWPYYAMCSTAGSVCGASVAYRLSRLGILHRRIEGAVFDRVTAFLKRLGSLALSLAAILPPPFPTSIL